MPARSGDLLVEQGADFEHVFPVVTGQGRPRNLAGWRAEAVIRHSPDSPEVARMRVTVTTGKVTASLPGVLTRPWVWRRARYEIRLVGPQGQRERLAAGRVLLDRQL